jgi:uncharacterized membrane protein
VGSGTINHINCKVVDDLIGLSLLHLLNIFLIQPFSHIQLETLGALIVLLLYLLREKEERVKKILNRKKYVFMETSYVDCYAFSL